MEYGLSKLLKLLVLKMMKWQTYSIRCQ